MSSDDRKASAASDAKANADEHSADTVDEHDPHKVEKLANAGKDTDVAEATE